MATTPSMAPVRRKRSESAFENLPASLSGKKAFADYSHAPDSPPVWSFRHVDSIDEVKPELALNIYRAYANAGRTGAQAIALDERECEVIPSDMKVAAAFALAGVCELEYQGGKSIIRGCNKIVDHDVIKKLDTYCEWDADKLIYHSLTNKICRFPVSFSKEFLKLFLIRKMLEEDGFKKDYFQYEPEGLEKVEKYVNEVWTACGLDSKEILKPMDIIKIKNELKLYELVPLVYGDSDDSLEASNLDNDQNLSEDESANYHTAPSDTEPHVYLMPQLSIDTTITRYEIRYCHDRNAENESVAIPYNNTNAAAEVITRGLDETDLDYFCQAALERKDSFCERFTRSCRAAGRWFMRNKRNILFNLIDILIGALIGLALTGIIGAPIYILAAIGTLVFWFALDMIVLGIRKSWHRHKSEKTQIELESLDNEIDKISAQTDLAEEERKERIKALETKRIALEKKQLKHLAFLAGEIGFTNMFNAMLDCDRAAQRANMLKIKAKDSVEDAIKYAKAMAELRREEERVGKSGKYVAGFLELLSIHRSRIEDNIERDIDYLDKLGIFNPDKKPESDQETSDESMPDDPASLGMNFIDNRGGENPQSTLRNIRSFLFSPALKEGLLNERLRACKMDKQKVLEALAKDLAALDPQSEESNTERVEKANTRIAALAFRAAAGINMKALMHQTNQERRDDVVKQCTKVSLETFKAYLAYYLRRIPYRLHEAGVSRALIAGTKLNATSLLKDAFPNPVALGGLGIIWWFFFRLLGSAFENKNNKINQELAAARLQYEHTYVEPSADAKPDWMKDERKRAKQCNGYFNAGVCDRDQQADLSMNECLALRREGKHSTAKLMPLVNELSDIQQRLADATEKVKQEVETDGTVSAASKEEVRRLALSYGLVNCAVENVVKQPGQTFSEFGRRLNLKVRQAAIVYPSDLQLGQTPAAA